MATTLDDIARAYEAITEAEERYRATLRAGIADGVQQVEISARLGRSREKIRQDAMPDEKREKLREADADRKRQIREAAKAPKVRRRK